MKNRYGRLSAWVYDIDKPTGRSFGDVLTLTDEHTDIDYLAQCAASHMRYEHWRDGHLVDSELELFTLRWWGVREFELALQACGFRDIAMTGSYRPAARTTSSPSRRRAAERTPETNTVRHSRRVKIECPTSSHFSWTVTAAKALWDSHISCE